MDAVLIILLLMGVCSITLALYILVDAKRNYMSPERESRIRPGFGTGDHQRYLERSKRDRRSGQTVSFPLMIDGRMISEDRRKLPDRRRAVAA